MIGPQDERARTPSSADFAESVTFAWSDEGRNLHGLARLGLAVGTTPRSGSALAVLFEDGELVGSLREGGLELDPGGDDWMAVELSTLRATIEEPLRRWRVAYDGGDHGFDLIFEAISAPAALLGDQPAVELGGMERYEQLCRVRGRAHAHGAMHEVNALGQRGHGWGTPDWDSLALARNVSIWMGEEEGGIAVASVRPTIANGHGVEAMWAVVVRDGEPVEVADPRLSTTFDGDGHARRAGLELWVAEDDEYPLRAAGEILCGTTMDLGPLELDLAFMRWHADGRDGIGRYEVLRRR